MIYMQTNTDVQHWIIHFSGSYAAASCREGWIKGKHKCYKPMKGNMNFEEARLKCESEMSNLYQPSFHSKEEISEENNMIAKGLDSGNYWTGLCFLNYT